MFFLVPTVFKFEGKTEELVQYCSAIKCDLFFRIDISACAALVPRLFNILSQLWLTDKPEVLAGVTHALGAVVTDCVGPASADPSGRHFIVVSKVFEIVQSGLQYQYHSAWKYILHLFGVLFEVSLSIAGLGSRVGYGCIDRALFSGMWPLL